MPAIKTCIHGIRPSSDCKECRREWQRQDRLKKLKKYRKKDRERYESRKAWRSVYVAARKAHIQRLDRIHRDWFHYCLLPGERGKIFAYQEGLDPLTREPLTPSSAIDHCHKTGLIRGILNWKTNQYLSHFERFAEALDYGIISEYLKNPPAIAALGGPRYGIIGRVTKKAGNRRYGPNSTREPFEDANTLMKRFPELEIRPEKKKSAA